MTKDMTNWIMISRQT